MWTDLLIFTVNEYHMSSRHSIVKFGVVGFLFADQYSVNEKHVLCHVLLSIFSLNQLGERFVLISIHSWSLCIEAPRKKYGCVIRSHVFVHSFPLTNVLRNQLACFVAGDP
jgi:hypothetical protein